MRKMLYGIFLLLAFCFLAGCHSTPPLGLNEAAAVQPLDELPENPLLLHAITSSIRPGDNTMSTLYGNDVAFAYAGTHDDGCYPPEAVLYEVTWQWQADEQWAGANIPRVITSVEQVAYGAEGKAAYKLYNGTPLREVSDTMTVSARITAISGKRMAVAP